MNTVEMRLQEKFYHFIKSGTKRVELRLLDEKRKAIRLGDEIVFVNRADENDTVHAKVKGLLYYDNFEDLFLDFDIKMLADETMTKEELLGELAKFYPAEEQAELGVVGIRFELI